VDQIFGVSKKKINPNAMDLEEMEQSTNKIDGFKERIENVTTLIEHRCSEGCRGDFFPEWNAVLGWGM
jgi:cyanophycin synthetase